MRCACSCSNWMRTKIDTSGRRTRARTILNRLKSNQIRLSFACFCYRNIVDVVTSSLSLNYSTALACATSTRTNRNTLLLPNNGSPPQTRFHAFLSLSNAVKKFVTFSHWPWPESLSQIPFIPNFETHPPLILIFFYCFRSILVSHFFLSTSPQSKTPRLETLQSDL